MQPVLNYSTHLVFIAIVQAVQTSGLNSSEKLEPEQNEEQKMRNALRNDFQDRLPSKSEINNAEQIRAIVKSLFKGDEPTGLPIAFSNSQKEKVVLAPALTQSLLKLLEIISSGKGFEIVPVESEFTTQQAANFLNVSQDYLGNLLDQGEIKFVKIGGSKKILLKDLTRYKKKRDKIRSEALSRLIEMDGEEIFGE